MQHIIVEMAARNREMQSQVEALQMQYADLAEDLQSLKEGCTEAIEALTARLAKKFKEMENATQTTQG